MYQRFSVEARQSIIRASRVARRFGRGYVSTEDLLLDLLSHGDCTAGRVFAALDCDVLELRRVVEAGIAAGGLPVPSRAVLHRAVEECQSLEHPCLGTGHLLLGLLREPQSVAGGVLHAAGLDAGRIRERIADVPQEN